MDPSCDIIRIGMSLARGATPDAPNLPSAEAPPAKAVPCFSSREFGRGSASFEVVSRGATTLPRLEKLFVIDIDPGVDDSDRDVLALRKGVSSLDVCTTADPLTIDRGCLEVPLLRENSALTERPY